jgi:hypothetical protein
MPFKLNAIHLEVIQYFSRAERIWNEVTVVYANVFSNAGA